MLRAKSLPFTPSVRNHCRLLFVLSPLTCLEPTNERCTRLSIRAYLSLFDELIVVVIRYWSQEFLLFS